ncbi:hypothetical protein CRG98_010800 [Punica granatum]|uniref:Protein ELC-like n=1 Tax=Punica granatum TaxID=22663 RepID=A0A2I0KKN7_PUNGR|nr:hypothetical protein CRG98_010800 [Punica granatum]
MGTPSPPNPQLTQQFLNSVLSQRGPSALPYSEDTKWLIRQHLVALTTTFPSLNPQTASFTHNDGRSVNLLQADGTVPMLFQGVTYNIPVVIWLMESYPRHAPCVYVNPTRDMIIKRPHAHEQLNRGLREMQDEKEGLEQQLQMVLMNGDVLDDWLRENEGKAKLGSSLDVDDAFECADLLSKQMVECTAVDLAIEDTVYSLDKAIQEGAIPFDQYLRNVRLLSREQFFHRATGIKVRAVQMQAQVASMAARAPPHVQHYVS